MKKISLIVCALGLFGCQTTTTELSPATQIIEIKQSELNHYWVKKAQKISLLKKRPTWLPKGQGEWTVLTVIDSNGEVIENTLMSSNPKGFVTQSQIDEMPKSQFMPAATNTERTPVKFYGTARIAPMNKL